MQAYRHHGDTRRRGDGNPATVLMMTHVLRSLPTAQHNAWVCSSGSAGYCATKEMLQNGTPGHTLLIESGDLRDVDATSEGGHVLLIYRHVKYQRFEYSKHIPRTVRHITVYGNVVETPEAFLEGCSGLTALDLSPLSQVTAVKHAFLAGCSGLTTLDLSPLSQVTKVQGSFLGGCTGLTALDLSPLSQVIEVQEPFLQGCTGIDAVYYPPLCDTPCGWRKVANQWVREEFVE